MGNRIVDLDKSEGKVSTLLPAVRTDKCVTVQGRSTRRVHTPADLRRIYRYVIGSFGWKAATCAIMDESGLKGMVEDYYQEISDVGLCSRVGIDPAYLEYVPENADELLNIPEGTVANLFAGCVEDEEISFGVKLRVVLALLIVVWGIWRRVKKSRLYRWILRRLIILAILGEILDHLESVTEEILTALLILEQLERKLNEVCDEESGSNDATGAVGASG